jgi:hypothetical protein
MLERLGSVKPALDAYVLRVGYASEADVDIRVAGRQALSRVQALPGLISPLMRAADAAYGSWSPAGRHERKRKAGRPYTGRPGKSG